MLTAKPSSPPRSKPASSICGGRFHRLQTICRKSGKKSDRPPCGSRLRGVLPPSHTTPIGAEPFALCPLRVNERIAAVGADILSGVLFLFCANADIVPAAVRLDGVF